MKKVFMFVPIISALMTGCLNDTYPITADGIDSNAACVALSVASISVGGNQSSTRSTSLADGDAIGISRIADGIYTAQNNFKYVNTVNVWGAANSIDEIVLTGNNNATLCAYSPYSSSTDISAIPLTSGVYSTASDFCYGYKPGVNSTNMGTGVSFSLNHAYAKLTLHFTKGVTFSGVGNVKKITVAGGASSATLNLSAASASTSNAVTGTPVTVGNGTTTLFNTVISTAYDVEMLMVPALVSSGLTFTVNVDGTDKTATLPASLLSELVADTNYTIPLEIRQKNGLDLGGATGTNYVSVTDWITTPPVTNPLANFYSVQPESNCYLVAPNTTIYIPVSRATAGNPSDFSSIASFTCGLLWSDVSTPTVKATAIGRFIKVETGASQGNSVVYAKNTNGFIVWSWHLWVTTTNFVPTYIGSTGWMDRNLGAMGAKSYGLYYQWGRKDPFSPYTISGGTVTKEATPSWDNMIASIRYPLTFYYGSDWYSTYYLDDDLWGGVSRKKTIYDPCPVGWKVSILDNAGGYPLSGIKWYWNDNDSGQLYGNDYRFFYPGAGWWTGSNGSYGNGGNGLNWTGVAVTNSHNAYGFRFHKYMADVANQNSRATGCPVRCVKE